MRVTLQPLLVLALGLAAAQDIVGNSARGLQGVDSNTIEAREPKNTKGNSKTTARVTSTTSHRSTSTTSSKSSSTLLSSSTLSTSIKVTSTSTSSKTTSTIVSSSTSESSSTLSTSGKVTSTSTNSETTSTAVSSSSTVTASTTTSSGAAQTPTRKWCDNSGSCSKTSCEAPVKQGSSSNSTSSAARRSYPLSLGKRAFVDPVTNWDKLAELPDTSDLSQYTSADFMPFGDQASAIYIDGLVGCTAIGVFSKQGMQAYHLWESPAYNKKTGVLLRDPVDTLWPANNKKFVTETLAKAKAVLSPNKAKFAGGELVIMLPKKGSSYLYEVDETYEWSDKTAAGKPSSSQWGRMVLDKPLVQQGQGVVDLIKNMAKEATGITTIHECSYVPNESDMTAGRFVVQYDPKSAGNKKAVQVWCEKTTQYPNGWTF